MNYNTTYRQLSYWDKGLIFKISLQPWNLSPSKSAESTIFNYLLHIKMNKCSFVIKHEQWRPISWGHQSTLELGPYFDQWWSFISTIHHRGAPLYLHEFESILKLSFFLNCICILYGKVWTIIKVIKYLNRKRICTFEAFHGTSINFNFISLLQ